MSNGRNAESGPFIRFPGETSRRRLSTIDEEPRTSKGRFTRFFRRVFRPATQPGFDMVIGTESFSQYRTAGGDRDLLTVQEFASGFVVLDRERRRRGDDEIQAMLNEIDEYVYPALFLLHPRN